MKNTEDFKELYNYKYGDYQLDKYIDKREDLIIFSIKKHPDLVIVIFYCSKELLDNDKIEKRKTFINEIKNFATKKHTGIGPNIFGFCTEGEIPWIIIEKFDSKNKEFGELRSQSYGDYQLGNYIDKGGNGAVFKIKYHPTMAIKIFFCSNSLPNKIIEKRRKRFIQEIKFMNKKIFDGIGPKVFEICTEGERPWIIMETCKSLQHNLENLNLEERVDICLSMILLLKKLHSINIAHRDIKPSNFLYSLNGVNKKLVLSDFGLINSDETESLTDTNENVGSITFCAPELKKGKKKNLTVRDYFKADMFSFGKTVWAVIKKSEQSFDDYSDMYHQMDRFEDLEYDYPKICFEPLYELIDKCTKYRPEERCDEDECIRLLKLFKNEIITGMCGIDPYYRFKSIIRRYQSASLDVYISDNNKINSILDKINEFGEYYSDFLNIRSKITIMENVIDDKKIYKFTNNSIYFIVNSILISYKNDVTLYVKIVENNNVSNNIIEVTFKCD